MKPLPFKFTFIILIKSVLSLSMIIPMIVENISISVWDLTCLYSLQLHSILLLPRMVIVLCYLFQCSITSFVLPQIGKQLKAFRKFQPNINHLPTLKSIKPNHCQAYLTKTYVFNRHSLGVAGAVLQTPLSLIKRPGVAGAVLHTASSLID